MSPRELIYFFVIGVAVLVAITILWFIFRKKRRIAIAFTSILVLGFIGYVLYFPTMKTNKHSEAYEIVSDYLDKNYPNRVFTVVPEHYEAGYTVGDFNVNDIETPTIGVILRVDKDKVKEIGTWSNLEYPIQQDLWREIQSFYESPYSLNKDLAEITKIDEWIDGELTAFALTVDDKPAIALFNYSKAGYGLLDFQEGEREGFVIIEKEGYVFIYVDERYQGRTVSVNLVDNKEFTFNVDQQKGQLIIEEQQ
ncbi:hypothetical protein QWT69_00845 [Sporosarcina oncorhynchi]|uniref:Uncharacterized protein n=1 Tax=Sporosarcina oncorhynchi TaxID=3056444 RepID=A0ABZ0L843_9BACL|nr:hypothetical protein [Sporosarcina sp. T2O-4]WOV87701.1 hypothetical protein QWT69_00845 [Sporosarcina sp. T2O-4]